MCDKKIDNSLAVKRPDLAKQWNYEKNGELKPEDVTCGSRKKVWWKCTKGHEWESTIGNRNNGNGCRYCSGRFVTSETCLATLKPNLAKEWHPIKNEKLTPNEVTVGSGRKAWWLCSKGHEWQSRIADRTKGIGCPYCAGKKACDNNSLAKLKAELAKEWHPTKNDDLTPHDITFGSDKKVWWLCSFKHEWQASINNRQKGTGCPTCSQYRRTSFPEFAIYFYLKKVFPDCIHGYLFSEKKIEVDIYIPTLNIGIEYDGAYFHKNIYKDLKKSKSLQNKLTLIRVREYPLPVLNNKDVVIHRMDNTEQSLERVIFELFEFLKIQSKETIHISEDMISIKKDLTNINNLRIFMELQESLGIVNPKLAKEWHPIKNGVLTPNHIACNSNKKAWWFCSKGHEWQATISNRQKGTGCPYCSGKEVCNDNSLATLNPKLAKEWHPTKNGVLTPNDVTSGSGIKVYWLCSKGHEWQTTINDRNKGKGCPYCSGKKVCEDNSLAILNPKLAREWHPIKNGVLKPHDITCGSKKKVYWLCSKGHEWEAVIYSRNNGNGCPYCYRNKRKNK